MPKFQNVPRTVDAVQWFPDPKLGRFVGKKYINSKIGYDHLGVEYTVFNVGLRTLNGFANLEPGEWIITGVRGERYPCKPDIFAETWKPA